MTDSTGQQAKNLRLALAATWLLIVAPYVLSMKQAGIPFLIYDCVYYKAIAQSLLEDHDFKVENNLPPMSDAELYNGQLAMSVEGDLVPKHQVLMPIVASPFYFLFGDNGLLLFNVLVGAWLVVLMFELNTFFYKESLGFVAVIVFAVGTVFLNYSYNFSPDLFAAALFLSGLNSILGRRAWRGTALLSLSVAAKITNLVLVVLVGAYYGFKAVRSTTGTKRFKEGARRALGVLTAFLTPLAPLLAYHARMFGSPFVTGYQKAVYKIPGGETLFIKDHAGLFNQPVLDGMKNIFFDREIGLFVASPILIVSIVGIFFLGEVKRKADLALLGVLCLVQIALFAKYDHWHNSSFSIRFVMAAIALLSVFFTAVVRKWWEQMERPEADRQYPA